MRIIAVMSGGDWTDAGVTHIVVNDEVDLDQEQVKYNEWYKKEYCPANRDKRNPKYLTFSEWLIGNGSARAATSTDVEEFWQHR